MRRRSTRLNGATAEALLDGHDPDTPVTWLLAAAAAPGRAEEIAGEAAARAAFAGARTTQAPFVRPPQARRSLASRLIAAKAVALVVLAAGATGGVALAANAQFARARLPAARHGVPEHADQRRVHAQRNQQRLRHRTRTVRCCGSTEAALQLFAHAPCTMSGVRNRTSKLRNPPVRAAKD